MWLLVVWNNWCMDSTLLTLGGYQPSPFPAPHWLMETLLVVGFFLHAIPMNVTLMGGLVSAVLLWQGKNKPDSYELRAGKKLASALPIFTTAAITNGIVPLLFLQILYGPLVYSSSILMATPWMSILLLVVLGYYGLYIFNYGQKKLGEKSPWFLLASSLLFLVVAFLFTNNMTLMLLPEKFLSLYQASRWGGSLNWGDPTVVPRYLHFILAAVAVTGLTMGCFGLYEKKRDLGYGNWLLKMGAGLFLGVTLLQTLVGPWFLTSLPLPVQQHFFNPADIFGVSKTGLSKVANHLFLTSLGLDLIALASMGIAWAKQSSAAFMTGTVSAVLLIAAMSEMRHLVRVFSTQAVLNPAAHPAEPQTLILGIFLVLFVALIGYLAWLAKVVMKSYQSPAKW
jgi:hypothetical protein